MFLFRQKKKAAQQTDSVTEFLNRFKASNVTSIPHALEDGLIRELLHRAVTEYNSASYEKAISTLEFALLRCTSEDDYAMVSCFLALFCYDEAQYERARLHIDTAVNLRPQFRSALNLMKQIYDIVNECRSDKSAKPDLIKLRNAGAINVSDLDILMHNIDVDSVRALLDNVDRTQFDRKIELYRKYHYKKRNVNLGAYRKRLDRIIDDLEECAPREFFTEEADSSDARVKQAQILEQVDNLCGAQKEVILSCVRDAKRMGDDTGKKLLLFSTWHFYLAGYARYQTMHLNGEFYHIIHRTMFPYAQEIENCLKERFPDLNVAEEIGNSTRDFGTKLAAIIRDAIGKESTTFDRMASDITWLFLGECGIRKSDPVGKKLYERLYDFVVSTDLRIPQCA